MRKTVAAILCITVLAGCKKNSSSNGPDFSSLVLTEYSPVPVSKTNSTKVFVHVMPWFETPETNSPAGTWGAHWTMANKNPNTTTGGKREIASYYYPLTGPYASGDKDLIEYQLLLMKLSGIDGVFIDWPGTIKNVNDYALMVRNTNNMLPLLKKAGLKYAIVYEDRNLDNNYVVDKVAQAKTDINYIVSNYFSQSNYETIGGQPLLLDFGPLTLTNPADWTDIFSSLTTKPAFIALWGFQNRAGSNAAGQYAWVVQGHTTSLSSFYSNSYTGLKITAAYPGFKDFYSAGNWPGALGWQIDHNGTATFTTTLDMALATANNYLQLVTWNDYGEGTMIEPTTEFGYGFLTILQQKLGVSSLAKADLEYVKKLFDLRKAHKDNSDYQKALNQVFYYMVSLQMDKAKEILNKF